MIKSQVSILNLKILYNILFEHKDLLKFEIYNFENELDLIQKNKKNMSVIISNKKIMDNSIEPKSIIILDNMPIKFFDLIDQINSKLLQLKYRFQSNFIIKKYKLDLNSRVMTDEKNNLKLTEREIEIILFLSNSNEPQSIDTLQKEVWGYSENLDTHTVETHVYRLRKKINEKFHDENFLISFKNGYKI